MIDLHCHLLPGIDDGAANLKVSLAMAAQAVADGIRVVACTPHIYPGLYENTAVGIQRAVTQLSAAFARRHISLQLVVGADVHLAPDLLERLRAGTVPTLHRSRYFLLEPPHHVAPPRFEASVFELAAAGYVPILTHPERLTWIESHYDVMQRLARRGVWMQLTAGSLTGRFGRRPRYWSDRMLAEGLVHLLATDAHSPDKRPPCLAEGRDAAAQRVGEAEASRLVNDRPRAVLRNELPDRVAMPVELSPARKVPAWGRIQELLPWR
ncbi:tyrosine-protein phosphatase [Tahibacter amnicola]|uniref:protein-tyrosine-phosphatase n=1 Tax=Tahibacter amnicola TaxID=2976241 RepID=A0ABY6BET3_9GAMM|nr:CpsB/CapC family capsule biosynthesis tyrosine phosphatase [Tahibacter amnicola]UXI66402.1 hypothetical protein N4264_16795 [Tahibacter amnicola]